MTTNTTDLEKLRELAEAATPGEHVALSCPDMPTDCCDYGVVAVALSRETCRVWNEADARYYAAANPATILSLIADLKAKTEENTGLHGEVQEGVAWLDAMREQLTLAQNERDAERERAERAVGALSLVRMSRGWQYMADETRAIIEAALAAPVSKPVFSHCPACAKDDNATDDWGAGVGCSADGPTEGCEAVWVDAPVSSASGAKSSDLGFDSPEHEALELAKGYAAMGLPGGEA